MEAWRRRLRATDLVVRYVACLETEAAWLVVLPFAVLFFVDFKVTRRPMAAVAPAADSGCL